MPPEDIDVSNRGIVEDEQEAVEKDAEIDVSNSGITEPLNDHHPGVEKSDDAETTMDRLIKSDQRQREEFFAEWMVGGGSGSRGEIDLADMSDVVKATHSPEEFEEEQERRQRDRERDELAEEVADELERRFTREERRETVEKEENPLEEAAELIRELKEDRREQVREYINNNPNASNREVAKAVMTDVS